MKYLIKIVKREEIFLDAIEVEIFPTNWGWIKFFLYDKPSYDARTLVYKILKKIYVGSKKLPLRILIYERAKTFILGVPFKVISHSFYLSLVIYDSLSIEEGPNIISENIPFNINKLIVNTILEDVDNLVHRIYFIDERIMFNPKPFKGGRYSKSLENRVINGYENASVKIKGIDHASLGRNACSPILTSKEHRSNIHTIKISEGSFLTTNTFTNPNTFKAITPKNSQIIQKEKLNLHENRLSLYKKTDLMRMFSNMNLIIQNFSNSRVEDEQKGYFKNLMNIKEIDEISEEERILIERNYRAIEEYSMTDKNRFEESKEFICKELSNPKSEFLENLIKESEINFNLDHKQIVNDVKVIAYNIENYKETGIVKSPKMYIPNSCGNIDDYSPTKGGWGGMP